MPSDVPSDDALRREPAISAPPSASSAPQSVPVQSFLRKDGGIDIERIGLRRHLTQDAYHFLRTARWSVLLSTIAGTFVLANAGFALLYLIGGDSIANARAGSFEDAFFFSVQTMATIGYGSMTPKGTYANVIATLEAISGLLLTAMSTGVLFTKFASPTPRVLFSNHALITELDGVPTLVFRMANERASHLIVEARVNVTLAYDELDSHGSLTRRLVDLTLRRSTTPLFALTWMVYHTVGENSPLFGLDAAAIASKNAGLLVTFTGIDDTLAMNIHARHAYRTEDIVFGGRFADVLRVADGRRVIDYRRFHDVERPS